MIGDREAMRLVAHALEQKQGIRDSGQIFTFDSEALPGTGPGRHFSTIFDR
jgi:hypothetical protein